MVEDCTVDECRKKKRKKEETILFVIIFIIMVIIIIIIIVIRITIVYCLEGELVIRSLK